MKHIIHIGLVLLLVTSLFGREVEKVELWRLEQFEKGEWASLSFGFGSWHGDYYSDNEKIVLQRLPDNRVLLSIIKDNQHGLPVAVRYITLEDTKAIREAVSDLHREALKEDAKGEYTEMLLKVTKPDGDNCGASAKFNSEKDTLVKFRALFDKLLKSQKSEQGSAHQPTIR